MGSLKTAASTAATAVNKPAAAAGQVVGAYRAAKNEAGGGFGGGLTGLKNAALGTAGNLWTAGKGSIPGVSGYRTGQQTLSGALDKVASNKAGYGAKNQMDQGQFGAMLLRNMPYGGGGGGGGNGKGRTPEEGAQNFTNQYNAAQANGFQPHGGGGKGANGKGGKKNGGKK